MVRIHSYFLPLSLASPTSGFILCLSFLPIISFSFTSFLLLLFPSPIYIKLHVILHFLYLFPLSPFPFFSMFVLYLSFLCFLPSRLTYFFFYYFLLVLVLNSYSFLPSSFVSCSLSPFSVLYIIAFLFCFREYLCFYFFYVRRLNNQATPLYLLPFQSCIATRG